MPCTARLSFTVIGLALGALSSAAQAGGCVGMSGGDMVLSASAPCLSQLRGDSGLRQRMVHTIDAQTDTVAAPRPHSANRPEAAQIGSARHGLTHPLARLSLLNAQSRYLWSLTNPTPTYYGQNQAR